MADNERVTTQWTGHDLLDLNGDKIGSITDVRYGDVAGGLTWLVVKTGLFGSKKILVPANDVRSTEDGLVVPYTKDRVKNAPQLENDEVLTGGEETELCTYYGLEYSTTPLAPGEGCGDERRQRAA